MTRPSCPGPPLPAHTARTRKQRSTHDDSFWLLEARHKHFNELMSDETRSLFREFVTDWNEGRLAEKYYAGLVAAPPRRTGHQWSFKGAAGGGGRPSGGGSMTAFMDEQRERREAERLAARQSDKAERSAWRRDQKEASQESALLSLWCGGRSRGERAVGL